MLRWAPIYFCKQNGVRMFVQVLHSSIHTFRPTMRVTQVTFLAPLARENGSILIEGVASAYRQLTRNMPITLRRCTIEALGTNAMSPKTYQRISSMIDTGKSQCRAVQSTILWGPFSKLQLSGSVTAQSLWKHPRNHL